MSAAIVLVGIGANFPNPGVYAQINFAAGPAGPASGPRNILVYGNQTSSGTATNDTVVYGPDTAIPVQTEADVIATFGAGGHHHRAFLRLTAVMGTVPTVGIYFVAVAPSAGANASTTETITGTATSSGNHRTWVVDQFVDTAINVGDTPTIIAGNVVASVNGQVRWPVTAANVAGVITYTAVNKGPEGNWILVQAAITPAVGTITTTTSLTANTKLTGGATSDNITNALATVATTRFYYQVLHDTDATNLGRLSSQINNNAAANVGLRQRGFAGSADTLANQITLATGINAPRIEIDMANGTDLTGLEIASNNVALYALFETSGSIGPGRCNFSSFPVTANDNNYWKLIPSRGGATVALTVTQITSALNNGLTPLALINNNQAVQLVKRCTSRSLNGAVQDFRVRDAHRVSVPDWWTDDTSALLALQFGGLNIAANPKPGVPVPPNSFSPVQVDGAVKGVVRKYEEQGLLKNGTQILQGMITQQESNPPNRVSNLTPLQVADIGDQFQLEVNQVA